MAALATPRRDGRSLKHIFETYDRNKTGGLEIEECRALLADLGLLKGMEEESANSWVVQQFAAADAGTKDSRLDLAEFGAYYNKITAPRLRSVLQREDPQLVERLQETYNTFAAFGARGGGASDGLMDGPRWAKLCKDTKLIGRSMRSTDADLIFMKAKERSARKLTFDQFVDALDMVATKKGLSVGEVARLVLDGEGPAVNATATEFVKFFDDKSTYTGVHAHGGPQINDKPADPMAALVRRSSSGPRSPQAQRSGSSPTPGMLTPCSSYLQQQREGRQQRLSMAETISPDDVTDQMVRNAFCAFTAFGAGSTPPPNSPVKVEMDSCKFAKMARNAGLLGGRLSASVADLCFAKARTQGSRKLGYKQFLVALDNCAKEKGVPVAELKAALVSCGGPLLNGTTPDSVRWYDDKSAWTGTHSSPATAAAAEEAAAVKASQPMGSRVISIHVHA